MIDELEHLSEAVVELQTRVAFQEHTIGELNDALAEQRLEVDALRRAMVGLARQVRELPDAEDADEEPPPPHY